MPFKHSGIAKHATLIIDAVVIQLIWRQRVDVCKHTLICLVWIIKDELGIWEYLFCTIKPQIKFEMGQIFCKAQLRYFVSNEFLQWLNIATVLLIANMTGGSKYQL